MRLLSILFIAVSLYAQQYFIDFRGQTIFSKERLYKELGFEKSLKQKIFGGFHPKVDVKLLPSLLDELQLFYKQEGYWHAKIEISIEGKYIYFTIEPNEPIKVARISITSDFPIKKFIPFKKGDIFVIPKFVKSKKDIQKALLKAGYCSYDFHPKVYVYAKSNRAYLVYPLFKGKVCKIKSIEVKGLHTLAPKIVESHIYLHPGEKFTLQKVDESYRRLYALEYFRSIRFDYSQKLANNIFLKIFAKERKRVHKIRAGIGFDTKNGIHCNFDYKNINYHSLQPQLDLFYATNRYALSAQLFIPSVKIAGSYVDIVPSIGINKERFDSFTQLQRFIFVKMLKEFYHFNASAMVRYENTSITKASSCIHNATYNLIIPSLELIYDRRDAKIAPTKGYFLKDDLEAGIGSKTYWKNLLSAGLLLPYNDFTLYLKGRIGMITNGSLPPQKLFYGGGVQSNRAYTYHRLYALDTPCKIGGKTLLEMTIEPRYDIATNIQVALFWDRTYLNAKSYSFFGKAADGIGLGGIYKTMIGELRIYFGFDPDNFGQNALNISFGAMF